MFNIITILAKKVLNYFEVMIDYIIAVTLHARETISCHFVHTNIISDDIMTIMNSYWIDSVFTLELKTHCIKQGESDLHWPQFSSCHAIPPQFSSVKADGQQM